MTVTPFDSALYRDLLSDEETAAHFSAAAELRALLRVEAALAQVQGRLGVIPAKAATRIAEVATRLEIDPASLAPATAENGVPIPGLVARVREAVGGEAANFVHWGATSQDIMDTGLVLRLRDCLEGFDTRLAAASDALAKQAKRYRDTVMAARTRSQQATPTTFGLKIAGWLAPLIRHRRRLAELRPRLLGVQLGGASGTLAALGDRGVAVLEALADELDLRRPPGPWHAERDALAELAGWLALVTGGLGKMGQDLILLGKSEIAEVRAGAGGGSSTMPQKSNPVVAETLVALARFNAAQVSAVHQAVLHAEERDGAAWMLEWLALPQMAVATGTALRHAEAAARNLVADADRMRANLDASQGLILAEAATFALARHMARPKAQSLVKSACREAIGARRHMFDVLAERTKAPIDWEDLRRTEGSVGSAPLLVDRLLASYAKLGNASS